MERGLTWPLALEQRPQTGELGALIRAWMEANLWTPQQTVALAQHCQPRFSTVSLHELEGLLIGKPIDPSPGLFKGMAAVHAAIASRSLAAPTSVHGLSPLDCAVLACSPLTLDAQANRPSWWFAVYCSEPSCLDGLAIPVDYRRPERLSSRLSRYLRRLMISQDKDPVEDGMVMLREVFRSAPKGFIGLHAWLLGQRELDLEDLHGCVHQLALLVHSLDERMTSVHRLQEELRLVEA